MITICICSPTPEIRRKLTLSVKSIFQKNRAEVIFHHLPSDLGYDESIRSLEQSDALVVDAAWERTYLTRRIYTRAMELGLNVWKEHEIHHSLGENDPDNSIQQTVYKQIQKLKQNATVKNLPISAYCE